MNGRQLGIFESLKTDRETGARNWEYTSQHETARSIEENARTFSKTVRCMFSPNMLRKHDNLKKVLNHSLWIPLLLLRNIAEFSSFEIDERNLIFYMQVLEFHNSDHVEIYYGEMCIRPRWALQSSVLICNVSEDTTCEDLYNMVYIACESGGCSYEVLISKIEMVVRHGNMLKAWSMLFNCPSSGIIAAHWMRKSCEGVNEVVAIGCVKLVSKRYDYVGNVPVEIEEEMAIMKDERIEEYYRCGSFTSKTDEGGDEDMKNEGDGIRQDVDMDGSEKDMEATASVSTDEDSVMEDRDANEWQSSADTHELRFGTFTAEDVKRIESGDMLW